MCVPIRGLHAMVSMQRLEDSFHGLVLSSCHRFRELNSGHQACTVALLLDEPSC